MSLAEQLDEGLLPAISFINSNQTLIEKNSKKLSEVQQQFEKIQRLLTETTEISAKSQEECKESDEELEQIFAELEHQREQLSQHTENYETLVTSLKAAFKTLVEQKNLEAIRAKMVNVLQDCASYFYHDFIFNNKKTDHDLEVFNARFKDVASIIKTEAPDPRVKSRDEEKGEVKSQNKDEKKADTSKDAKSDKPQTELNVQYTFNDNANLNQLNFSELEKLINNMLTAFYKQGSWLPWYWGDSKQRVHFINLIANNGLTGFTQVDTKNNKFSWQWPILQDAELNLTLPKFNRKLEDALQNQEENLTIIRNRLTAVNNKLTTIKSIRETEERQRQQNFNYVTSAVTETTQAAQEMQARCSEIPEQILALQQLILELQRAAADIKIPYDGLQTYIKEVIALTEAIKTNSPSDTDDAETTKAAAAKVKLLDEQLKAQTALFTTALAPTTQLIQASNGMKEIFAKQQSVCTPKDNLIHITRKLIGMLDDVKYFGSKTRYGGGEPLLVDGITYYVPRSYLQLYNAKVGYLNKPDYEQARAFWAEAKRIEIEARKRGSYRYFFFKVRSNEMDLLHNLIRELNINNPETNVDNNLDIINPNWRTGWKKQDKIPSAVQPSFLKPSLRRAAASRTLVNSSGSSSSSNSVDLSRISLTSSLS